ncbi:ATP-binding protein [Falsochrobactrum shanghaiense]
MKAIFLKTAEIRSALAQAFARFHASSVLMPVLLLAAVLASGFGAGFAELAVLVASLAGMAMVLSALGLMGLPAPFLAALNLVLYGAGLCAVGLFAGDNAALWLMAAALPLEVWFASRRPSAVWAGVALSALILTSFTISGGNAVASGSLASVAVLLLYTASLIARSFNRSSAPLPAARPVASLMPGHGDIRIAMDREGVMRDVDEGTARLLGVEARMLEGAAFIDRVHVADRVQYLSLLADLRCGKAARPADIRLRSMEKGSPVFRSYRMEGFCAGDDIVLAGRSLAGEQELIEQIDALKAQLEAERIGKNRLLATVSHELRTPLNSIIGFSDMLSHEFSQGRHCGLENEKQREYAGLIHQSGHYLLELVNSVLDNSRLEQGSYRIEPGSFAFREAADMCASIILPQAEKKGIAFCHRVNAAIGEVVADRRALQQILLNLAANAVKFTERGGCVTIDAARVVADGRAMLEITVSDTGIGIAPEDMQRIGTPFMRADNSYTRAQEGSGLGLSVVKGLVELHQGTMKLKSSVGEGTVVIIHLPVAGPQNLIQPQSDPLGESDRQLGTVIDMHRHQGERHDERQKDENRKEGHAQTRKTA